MKRRDFLKHLASHHCVILREGNSHTIVINTINNRKTSVPRHREIKEVMAKVICKQLDIPSP
jgi:mRNA interferase HicA